MTELASPEKTIILASTSPRRREMLKQIGLTFTIDPANVDEQVLSGERPEEYALRVAQDKARVAAARAKQGLIIAADTIVVLGDTILGKPADAVEAERMLTQLSGKQHRVITGLIVHDVTSKKAIAKTAITSVWFRKLEAAEIKVYVQSGEPLDKAGAYGIQEKGALFVEKIEGCYFNVVGLPLSLLGEMLAHFSVTLF